MKLRTMPTVRPPAPKEEELAPAPISSVGVMAHEAPIRAETQNADHFLALEARALNGPPGYVESDRFDVFVRPGARGW